MSFVLTHRYICLQFKIIFCLFMLIQSGKELAIVNIKINIYPYIMHMFA